VFLKKGGSPLSCFRVNTDFDFPPQLVLDYISDIPKRMSWEDGYDSLNFIRKFRMQTALLHVKVKAQWPLGARDVLLIFQGITNPENGSIYLGSYSVEHPEVPIDPKMVRIQTSSGHYMF
jgi:START domain